MFVKMISAIAVLALTPTTSAHGFAILLDQTLAYCDEDYSGGITSYNSLHINNDGLLTFGSVFGGATSDLADNSFGPAIAGLFRNSPYEAPTQGRIN